MSLIRNTEKAGRCIDFSGLNRSDTMSKDSVYCSDVDGIMEFHDKYLIIFEIKEKPFIGLGQRLLFERLIDSWIQAKPGRKGIVLFATHSPDIVGDIPIGECTVVKAYQDGSWKQYDSNLLDILYQIGKYWNIKKLQKK